MLLIASLLVLLALPSQGSFKERRALNIVFIAAVALHLMFAKTGWFYRYEAYLVILGISALGASAGPWVAAVREDFARARVGRVFLAVLLAAVVTAPISIRGIDALRKAPLGSSQVFRQQFQMGLFVARFYPGAAVAANDIGVISYLANPRLLDLVGLASMEVARANLAGTRTQETLAAFSRNHGIRLVVAYDWILAEYGGPLSSWQKVGQWTLAGPAGPGQATVSFFATDLGDADALARNLRTFADQLPPNVLASAAETGG